MNPNDFSTRRVAESVTLPRRGAMHRLSKRCATFISALCTFLVMIPATVAAQDKFKNESTGAGYATLQDAVNAVQDGQTIIMLDNVTSAQISLNVDKTYTLDLGGKILSGSDSPFLYITNGTVSIQNGSVVNSGASAVRVHCASATVNIYSGSYTGKDNAVYCTAGTAIICLSCPRRAEQTSRGVRTCTKGRKWYL